MKDVTMVEGDFNARGYRVAIVASRVNNVIVERLIEGALNCLEKHHVEDEKITIYRCPGAFELPLVSSQIVKQTNVDAVIAVGVLIRGDTIHFDLIASEVIKGLSQVSMDTDVPVGFGVLTTESMEQAFERSESKYRNIGFDTAQSSLEMISLLRKIKNVS